jgi:hypothetical protein
MGENRKNDWGDLDLGLGVKEGIGELFALFLSQRRLDDLEIGDFTEKALDGCVRARGLSRDVWWVVIAR